MALKHSDNHLGVTLLCDSIGVGTSLTLSLESAISKSVCNCWQICTNISLHRCALALKNELPDELDELIRW